jgi:nucleotide-binding universal stress UspA family protein
MAYRSVLVPLAGDPPCSQRTRAALRLARAFDAHLSGVAATGVVDLADASLAAASLAEFAARATDMLRLQADEAVNHFESQCLATDFHDFEAFVDAAEPTRALLQHAPGHDLVVMTQADPSRPDHAAARKCVEHLVLYSPRPTLVLPYASRQDGLGSAALVAWDDSREAARAVADALPLLRRASRVHVVSWHETGLLRSRGQTPGLGPIRAWLERHGVAAEAHADRCSGPVADAILSRAADLGAGLIVMGAWGHARWAERVMGGATRGLLEAMTVPVMMSH